MPWRAATALLGLMRALGAVKLLILDDWGLELLGPEQRLDILEIVEDRYGRGAPLITNNRAVSEWGTVFGGAVVSRVILDRLWHHSHVIAIRGEVTGCAESACPGCSKPRR